MARPQDLAASLEPPVAPGFLSRGNPARGAGSAAVRLRCLAPLRLHSGAEPSSYAGVTHLTEPAPMSPTRLPMPTGQGGH